MGLKLNKKGFTMVELLAVIVILGILSIISISAVQGIISRARDRYYKSQEDNFVMATQSYLQNNKTLQPKVSGQTVTVYLKDLRSAKYIDEIVDYKKNTCNTSKSYVKIFKYEDEVYYTSYIECPDYKTNISSYTSNIDIDAKFLGDDQNLNKAGVIINIKDNNNAKDASGNPISIPIGIVSYQYKIYVDGNLKYTSDLFNTKKVTEENKTVSLVSYTPGIVKISVTATNMYGLSLTKTFTKPYIDEIGPSCTFVKGDSTEWKTGTRTITVGCNDGAGAGCKRDDYTYEFTGDVKVGQIKIEDKAGNKTSCDVNVYIDNNPPVIELKVYKKKSGSNEKLNNTVMNSIKTSDSQQTANLTVNNQAVNGWLNKEKYPEGVYLELAYNDISSTSSIEWKWNEIKKPTAGNALKSAKKITPASKKGSENDVLVDEGYREGQIIATDQFGHTSIININIPMDRTPPTYTKEGDSTTWTKDNRTVTINCLDDLSGCDSSPGAKTYTSTLKLQKYTLKDKAGNSMSFNADIYVDKTNPKCSAITGDSTSWTKNDRTIKTACTDADSGCSQTDFSKKFDTSTKVGIITISDIVGNTTNCNVNAYVDKTPPICNGSTGASTTWTNSNRTINSKCKDDHSGCTQSSFAKTFSSSIKVGQITIKDNVGWTTNCDVNAYVDKDRPTCGSISGASTSWTASNRSITVACNDTGGSGCSSVTKSYSSTTKTSSITLKDGAGNTVSCGVNVYVDKTSPSCGSISGASTSWTKNDRNVSVACSDSDSGCSQTSYSNKFTSTTKTGTITIKDKVGNTRNCTVNAYVDKTAPSCGSISGASTSWTSGNRTITTGCSDSHSGCTNSSYSKTFTSSIQTGTITVRDNAGNTKDCTVNAYIDKSAPSCGTISGASTSWTNGNRTITAYCNDSGGSGCSSVTRTYSSTTRTATIQLRDGAGNSVNCNVNVYVDKTAPSCNGVWGDSTSWTSGDRSIGVGCSDSDSGCSQGSFSRYFNWTVRTDGITIWDYAGNSNWCGVNVFVDKTPPDVWTSYGPVASSCGGKAGVLASYEVREYESGLAYVGDWWGWDWDFNGANALNRYVGWGSSSFSKTHHWSANCTSVRAPGDYCYRIKVLARDIAGNETHHVSPNCTYKG